MASGRQTPPQPLPGRLRRPGEGLRRIPWSRARFCSPPCGNAVSAGRGWGGVQRRIIQCRLWESPGVRVTRSGRMPPQRHAVDEDRIPDARIRLPGAEPGVDPLLLQRHLPQGTDADRIQARFRLLRVERGIPVEVEMVRQPGQRIRRHAVIVRPCRAKPAQLDARHLVVGHPILQPQQVLSPVDIGIDKDIVSVARPTGGQVEIAQIVREEPEIDGQQGEQRTGRYPTPAHHTAWRLRRRRDHAGQEQVEQRHHGQQMAVADIERIGGHQPKEVHRRQQ